MLLLALAIACGAAPAHASGFVYTAVPAAACVTESPCAAPYVLVVDADTAAVVIRLPLPVHTQPAGMAISADGVHLYVSNRGAELSGVTSLTVIDARRHRLIATYPLAPPEYGLLAVRGDDSRVFIGARSGRLSAFETTAHTVVGSVDVQAQIASIATSVALDRVFVLFRLGLPGGGLSAFDAGSLALAGHIDTEYTRFGVGMSLSSDEQHLHVLLSTTTIRPTGGGVWLHLDPETLAVRSAAGTLFPSGDPVEIPTTGEFLVASAGGRLHRGATTVQVPGEVLRITVPPGDRRAFVAVGSTPSPESPGIDALVALDLATNAIVATLPLAPAASSALTSTPHGAQACSYGLDSAYSSFPVTGGVASLRLTTSCDWSASGSEPWLHLSTTDGSGSGVLTLTVDPHVLPTPRAATVTVGGQLVTVTQAGGVSDGPFGVVDTPADDATGVIGAIPVTGWALDDVGVSGVRVFRSPVAGEGSNLVYLGSAALIEGARPDVAAYLPSLPYATRAGWGMMVLTNGLPNGGNGAYRLWVYADDVEGHTSLLGTKSVTATNGTAAQPFGAIDTPDLGDTVSGTIVNFGWALTPAPGGIPSDGSTIDVIVDGQSVGHPVYGIFRADIADLFPGYVNTNGAVGYYVFDTTTLTNGLHTVAWVVRDDQGRAEGIGSRYFRVFNP